MICASCGRQNPAGAHYCIHCGAEQSVPTPIAAVAAASTALIAHGARARAANAAQAEPASVAPLRPANAIPSGESPPTADGASSPEPPAYDALPRRHGLALALVAGCMLVALAAIVGWYLHSGAGSDVAADGTTDEEVGMAQREDATKRGSAPESVANAPSAATTGAPSSGGAEAPVASRAAAAPSAEKPTAGAGPASGAEPAPIEIRQLPARPPPARQRRLPPEKAAAPSPPAAASEATPAPAPRTSVAAAPAAVAPVSDRWTRMNEEMSRCTREDFITRVICSQRVRFRYCEGYWGKVEQCPASPPPERGQ